MNFIPHEEALDLRNLGFDVETILGYDTYKRLVAKLSTGNNGAFVKWDRHDRDLKAPLYEEAFKFFRDKYNLLGNVYSNSCGYLWEIHDAKGGTHRFLSDYEGDDLDSGTFTTYEKAQLECLRRLINECKKTK